MLEVFVVSHVVIAKPLTLLRNLLQEMCPTAPNHMQ
jgi:hypothetical protein